tara:strand:- start:571 stop:1710 length:1140 start_codon:yes stop_codon:yes gene_type:complete
LVKNIVHQLSLSEIGGVQRSFSLYLSYALKKSDFKHFVYSRYKISDNYENVKEYRNNIENTLFNKIKFLYYINSNNYLIHFYNNLGSNTVNKLLSLIPSSNIIFHERGSAWNANYKAKKIFMNNSLKAKIIIANSNASKLMLNKKFGIEEKKIKVIYNGFFSTNDKFLGLDHDRYSKKFSVGYLGRLDTPKGVHVFVKAAKKLPNFDFFIAGSGAWENILKDLAKGNKNIYFLGSLREPMKFLSKMDIIIVPSIREPLGNTIIEAGYCKKPVIAANIDGISEIIQDNVNGILIDPDNDLSFEKIPKDAVPIPELVINPKTQELQKPKEIDHNKLCEFIIKLEASPLLRKEYGEKLYESVKNKFNIEAYFENLEKIYKKF